MVPTKASLRELDLEVQLSAVGEDAVVTADEQVCVDTGLLIRRLRLKKGLTQDGLASKIGMPQPYLSDLERGKSVQGPTLSTLMRIARACGENLLVVPESELGQLRQVNELTKRQSRRAPAASGLPIGQVVDVEYVTGEAPRSVAVKKRKSGSRDVIEAGGDLPRVESAGGGLRKRYSGAGIGAGGSKRPK